MLQYLKICRSWNKFNISASLLKYKGGLKYFSYSNTPDSYSLTVASSCCQGKVQTETNLQQYFLRIILHTERMQAAILDNESRCSNTAEVSIVQPKYYRTAQEEFSELLATWCNTVVCRQIPERGTFQSKDLFCKERQGINYAIHNGLQCTNLGDASEHWSMEGISFLHISSTALYQFSHGEIGKVTSDLSFLHSTTIRLSPELPLFFFLIFFSVLCHQLP